MPGESRAWEAWQHAAVNSTLALATDRTKKREAGVERRSGAAGWGIIRDAAPAQARPGRVVAAKPEAMLRIGGQQNVSPGRGIDGNAEAAAHGDEPSSR